MTIVFLTGRKEAMSERKAIIIDLDGTLFNSNKDL